MVLSRATVSVCGGMTDVRGLAEEVGLHVDPLQDILGHAQDRIHRLDLFVSEKGETCDPEQGVERIHLDKGLTELRKLKNKCASWRRLQIGSNSMQ